MFTHMLAVRKDCFHAENSIKSDSTATAHANQQTGCGLIAIAIHGVEKAGKARKRKEGSSHTGIWEMASLVFYFLLHFSIYFDWGHSIILELDLT